jgi:sugar lactone lactonase YvrE
MVGKIAFLLLLVGLVAGVVMALPARAGKHARTVITYDAATGELPEGIAFDRSGNMYVSLAPLGQIRSYSPQGAESIFATFDMDPEALGVLGLAADRPGNVYAAVASGLRETQGVWRITPDGDKERLPGTEAISFPNALAFDARGNLYVTESIGDDGRGGIWRVAPGGSAEPWIHHEALSGVENEVVPPIGANGIVHFNGTLYVANTTTFSVVRVPIQSDGSPGTPVVIKKFGGDFDYLDGITADVHGNLYPLVIGRYELVRLNPRTGEATTLATADDGLHLPASLAFGSGMGNRQAVYITNFAYTSLEEDQGLPDSGPAVVRVEVGAPGWPLP